jgi:hypothetical protein
MSIGWEKVGKKWGNAKNVPRETIAEATFGTFHVKQF